MLKTYASIVFFIRKKVENSVETVENSMIFLCFQHCDILLKKLSMVKNMYRNRKNEIGSIIFSVAICY